MKQSQRNRRKRNFSITYLDHWSSFKIRSKQPINKKASFFQNYTATQLTFTFSKSTTEPLEKGEKYVQS